MALGRKASLTEDIPENQENAENPLPRTREEVVSEELLINGKTYRHTYQRKVVLERQKTREVTAVFLHALYSLKMQQQDYVA